MIEGGEGMYEAFNEIVARFRKLWEGMRSHVQSLLTGFRKTAIAVRRCGEAFARLGSRVWAALQGILAQVVWAAQQAYEGLVRWNVRRLGELALALLDDPGEECQQAGGALERAIKRFDGAEEPYDYTETIRLAVGALEAVASVRLQGKRTTLGKAIPQLIKRGIVSDEEAAGMSDVYRLRSKTPGVAHWVGGCSRYKAVGVLLLVRVSLEALVDTSPVKGHLVAAGGAADAVAAC